MSDNLYQAYVVGRWRREHALRDAEQWRLAKAVKKADNSRGGLQLPRLRTRQLALVRPDREASNPRPGPRQAASGEAL